MRASTFYSDYFSQNTNGNNYVFRGGGSSRNPGCGSFCVYASLDAYSLSLGRGATISFKLEVDFVCARRFIVIIFMNIKVVHFILFVVVILIMVTFVGLSLLMRALVSHLPTGVMVLPYHLNQLDELLLPDVL